MKRSLAARTPSGIASQVPAPLLPAAPSAAEAGPAAEVAPAPAASSDKKWEFDGPQGIPAPVIRANMISFRVSYQGRVQVAFFDQE
ncbi:MAG TPA: hypothetical protein VN699_17850 [Pirellulales bacterium]|nr:hypothetical protein [Pirellulales bacterium]